MNRSIITLTISLLATPAVADSWLNAKPSEVKWPDPPKFIEVEIVPTKLHKPHHYPKLAILPPAEYDKPFPGKLTIYRGATEDDVRKFCPNTQFTHGALACTYPPNASKASCEIMIVADDVIERAGWTYNIVFRHERAHCESWPSTHPNARIPTPADYEK